MLSGVPAIHGNSLEAILVSVMTVEPEPLSSLVAGVPPRLEALVMSALSKDADKRPRNADEMMDVIECSPKTPARSCPGAASGRCR